MSNTTLIIPVRIDSNERRQNIDVTLRYLLQNTDVNIIIKEDDKEQKLNIDSNDRIKYFFVENKTNIFHRTRLLNEMLSMVKTPVVANYDADVLLFPEVYKTCEELILKQSYDLIYPYGFEKQHQRIILNNNANSKFFQTLNLNDLDREHIKISWCRFGHVQFFNTESYRNGFMENENYIDWGPEDEERGLRFTKLGYKVAWIDNLVFHQEHPPSIRSNEYNNNEILHNKIKQMNKDELIDYYNKQEYFKKYYK